MLPRLALLFLCFTAALQAQEIRIAVSDLLSDFMGPKLEAYGAENDLTLKVEGIGSLPAMDRLRTNEVDIALVAIPEGVDVPRSEFRAYPFAYDAAVIAVNANNPLNEISIGRLGGIYGLSEEYSFNTWGDLGMSGWGSRKIKPMAGQNESSVSLELFKFTVLQSSGLKPSVVMVRGDEVEALLEADPASIAITTRLPDNTEIKALMVSTSEQTPAYGPNVDNIHYGDYPIRLSFFVLLDPKKEGSMRELIRFLLSDSVATTLQENDIYELPGTVRRKLTIDLELVQ